MMLTQQNGGENMPRHSVTDMELIEESKNYGDRGEAFLEAMHKVRTKPPFDPMPWHSIISNSRTTKDMALAIRVSMSKSMPSMAGISYKDPGWIVQWSCEQEELARSVERCANIAEAIAILSDRVDRSKLKRNWK